MQDHRAGSAVGSASDAVGERVVDRLNATLHDLFAADEELLLLGEDVIDPYGGAFKVTRGLDTAFPGRVRSTPISEAAITGVATGRAMRGKATMVEIMFGDFVTLAVDQLVNHAAKVGWLYGLDEVPLLMRTPMGGRRGYGATHSQSIEKLLCGVPGLTVLAMHQYSDPGRLLRGACALRQPVLFVENKVLYGRRIEPPIAPVDDPDVAIVASGGMVEHAVRAAERLERDEELVVRVVAVEQLWPFPDVELRRAIGDCDLVVVADEATPGYGFASECARALVNHPCRVELVTAADHPLPAAVELESQALPDADDICARSVAMFEAAV